MSGVPAEQDNETTDCRTTRQGKEQRAEGKALRECVLPGFTTGLAEGKRASAFAQGYGRHGGAKGRSRNDEAA
jgi:hypothetical protein